MSNSFTAVHIGSNALRLLRKQSYVSIKFEVTPGVAIDTTKRAVFDVLRALDREGLKVEYRYTERTLSNVLYRDVYLRAIPK
jgi:hypothetical protein